LTEEKILAVIVGAIMKTGVEWKIEIVMVHVDFMVEEITKTGIGLEANISMTDGTVAGRDYEKGIDWEEKTSRTDVILSKAITIWAGLKVFRVKIRISRQIFGEKLL